jgi:hypothetical protein
MIDDIAWLIFYSLSLLSYLLYCMYFSILFYVYVTGVVIYLYVCVYIYIVYPSSFLDEFKAFVWDN